MDLGKIIISEKALPDPKDNKDIFVVLAEAGIITFWEKAVIGDWNLFVICSISPPSSTCSFFDYPGASFRWDHYKNIQLFLSVKL
jgi:hypothetical protein